MKALIHILFLLILFTPFRVHSQNFAPLGAEWHYEVKDVWGNLNYSKWTVVSDTIILGQNTSKIIHSNANVSGILDTIIYVYENNGIVYKYLKIDNLFDTLYNFNATVGDSWSMNVDTNCSLLVTVDSTSTININSNNLKVLYISTMNSEFSGSIIEKIGHQITPLPDINFLCYSVIGGSAYYNGLRCYADSVIGVFNTGLAQFCNSMSTGINVQLNENIIKIYPNPSSRFVYIESPNNKINKVVIHNSQGVIIEKFYPKNKSNLSINIKDYSRGLYFFRVYSNQSLTVKKIIHF